MGIFYISRHTTHTFRCFIHSYLHPTYFRGISFLVGQCDIIYRYKYATDFVNVDIKLLNTEAMETEKKQTAV
jgi:hypothetical protein